jgi:hypothetical protein
VGKVKGGLKSKSLEVAQVLFTKAGHDLQAAELLSKGFRRKK